MTYSKRPAGAGAHRDSNGSAQAAPFRSLGASRVVTLCFLGLSTAACTTTGDTTATTQPVVQQAEIDTAPPFTEAEYGVPASTRVTTALAVPKGGGRELIGKPYQIAGKWYTPAEDPDYNRSGLASWYGPNFHGRRTANGEIYDQYHLSAAHPTFPLPSYARVTNEENGHSVMVRVNDRGPFTRGRIIDVSSKAADLLGFKNDGVANVNVEYVGPAELDGHDMPFLMASYRRPGEGGPTIAPEGQIASGVMLAMNSGAASGVPGVMSDAQMAQQQLLQPVPVPAASDATTAAPVAQRTEETVVAVAAPAPAQALEATAVPAAASVGGEAIAVVLSLPEIGPVLPERPSFETAKTERVSVSAYAENRLQAASGAFETVLVDDDAVLSVETIIGAWKNRVTSGR